MTNNYLAIFELVSYNYLDKSMSYIMYCMGQFNRLTIWNFLVIYCGSACTVFR